MVASLLPRPPLFAVSIFPFALTDVHPFSPLLSLLIPCPSSLSYSGASSLSVRLPARWPPPLPPRRTRGQPPSRSGYRSSQLICVAVFVILVPGRSRHEHHYGVVYLHAIIMWIYVSPARLQQSKRPRAAWKSCQYAYIMDDLRGF